jgi:hypothetical protein
LVIGGCVTSSSLSLNFNIFALDVLRIIIQSYLFNVVCWLLLMWSCDVVCHLSLFRLWFSIRHFFEDYSPFQHAHTSLVFVIHTFVVDVLSLWSLSLNFEDSSFWRRIFLWILLSFDLCENFPLTLRCMYEHVDLQQQGDRQQENNANS